jgi:uracil-DNA glycosylase family 4
MSWDERQRAMLAEMGLRVWAPLAPTVAAVPTTAVQAPPAALAEAPAVIAEPLPVLADKEVDGGGAGVLVDGPGSAHWLIVSDAPGEQREASRLLANMLRAIEVSSAADGPPEQQARLCTAQQGRPYLESLGESAKPRIILALGPLAVQALLGSNEPLGKLRGRVHDYRGIPLIVSFAPGYLLRNLADKARAWEDLCLARATLQGLGPA